MSTRATTLKELREMTVPKLQGLLQEKQQAYHGALLKVHQKEQSNVRALRVLKKDMARLHTILRSASSTS